MSVLNYQSDKFNDSMCLTIEEEFMKIKTNLISMTSGRDENMKICLNNKNDIEYVKDVSKLSGVIFQCNTNTTNYKKYNNIPDVRTEMVYRK